MPRSGALEVGDLDVTKKKYDPKDRITGEKRSARPTSSKSEANLAGDALEIPSIIHGRKCTTVVLDAVIAGVAFRKTSYR